MTVRTYQHFEVSWDVADFDALVNAGDSVMVRAVATNELQLTTMSEPFSIKLDAGVHPVDLLRCWQSSLTLSPLTETNADSGGPQGTVVINGYTPQRTHPEMASLQLVINDEVVGTSDSRVFSRPQKKSQHYSRIPTSSRISSRLQRKRQPWMHYQANRSPTQPT